MAWGNMGLTKCRSVFWVQLVKTEIFVFIRNRGERASRPNTPCGIARKTRSCVGASSIEILKFLIVLKMDPSLI